MICEILHPIYDALDDEFGFHGFGCGGNCGSVRRAKGQIGNAQNCVALNKEKGIRNILPGVHKNCLDNCSIK